MLLFRYAPLLKSLLYTDYVIFKQMIVDKAIDLLIWVSTIAFVTGYLMPSFGVEITFGSFMVAGVCASSGLFEVFPSVMHQVSDFEGDRIISYYTTLPMPTSLVFVRMFLYYALSAMVLGSFILPVSKLILWNRFDLSNLHVPKFILAFVMVNFLYGALTVWTISRVKSAAKIGSVWMRFIYPMWYLGGFQFTWYVMHRFFPAFAYVNLLNPMSYVMEVIRGSILGAEGYINYWLCLMMLLFFIVFFMWHGIRRLKKQLDFI